MTIINDHMQVSDHEKQTRAVRSLIGYKLARTVIRQKISGCHCLHWSSGFAFPRIPSCLFGAASSRVPATNIAKTDRITDHDACHSASTQPPHNFHADCRGIIPPKPPCARQGGFQRSTTPTCRVCRGFLLRGPCCPSRKISSCKRISEIY
jgi:hypothetical protein